MNDTIEAAKQLLRIAEQLRKINPESDVRCQLQVLTGDAARIIEPHWNLITERSGFGVEENPFPSGDLRTLQAEREIWANTWLAIAIPLSLQSIGRIEFGMPRLTETRLADGTIDCVMQLSLTEWKPIAEDSARICEYVAGLIESPVGSEGTSVPVQDWKGRRDSLGETVEDQMLALFKKDPRTAAMTSPEIEEILKCSESSVRKKTNKVWQMFKAEKKANQARLKRRHTTDSTDDIDDE